MGGIPLTDGAKRPSKVWHLSFIATGKAPEMVSNQSIRGIF
jgi:hypothetical protein